MIRQVLFLLLTTSSVWGVDFTPECKAAAKNSLQFNTPDVPCSDFTSECKKRCKNYFKLYKIYAFGECTTANSTSEEWDEESLKCDCGPDSSHTTTHTIQVVNSTVYSPKTCQNFFDRCATYCNDASTTDNPGLQLTLSCAVKSASFVDAKCVCSKSSVTTFMLSLMVAGLIACFLLF